ncbi:MAG: NAD(P)/FAD-dependent oxidoreductase [Rhodobacteraceae bacterium]|nr:NAD(P)/FAD-dependent oxidoreductase [Paracoccaceae bacterium]
MTLDGMNIAVIGGGVGGLAAGAAASTRGARVTVFEKTPRRTESGGGSGIQISPNGTRVLRALGSIDRTSLPSMPARLLSLKHGPSGREIARLDIHARHDDARYLLVRRSDLVAFLADRAEKRGATLLTGTRADVSFRDGRFEILADAHPLPGDFDVVVASDGIQSSIRQRHLPGGRLATETGQRAWRALASISSASERLRSELSEGPCLFTGPGKHLVVYVVPGGPMINITAITRGCGRNGKPASRTRPEHDQIELRALYAGWCDSVVSLLDGIQPPEVRELYRCPVPAALSRANLVAIGDAAHPMLPHLAQGASAALEDAWTLVEALANAQTCPAAFTAYERRRRSRVVRLQSASERSGWIYQLKNPFLRLPVHLGLRAAKPLLPVLLRQWYGWVHDHDVVAGTARN